MPDRRSGMRGQAMRGSGAGLVLSLVNGGCTAVTQDPLPAANCWPEVVDATCKLVRVGANGRNRDDGARPVPPKLLGSGVGATRGPSLRMGSQELEIACSTPTI